MISDYSWPCVPHLVSVHTCSVYPVTRQPQLQFRWTRERWPGHHQDPAPVTHQGRAAACHSLACPVSSGGTAVTKTWLRPKQRSKKLKKSKLSWCWLGFDTSYHLSIHHRTARFSLKKFPTCLYITEVKLWCHRIQEKSQIQFSFKMVSSDSGARCY